MDSEGFRTEALFISHLVSFAKCLPKVPFSCSTCITPQCRAFPLSEAAGGDVGRSSAPDIISCPGRTSTVPYPSANESHSSVSYYFVLHATMPPPRKMSTSSSAVPCLPAGNSRDDVGKRRGPAGSGVPRVRRGDPRRNASTFSLSLFDLIVVGSILSRPAPAPTKPRLGLT